LKAVKAELRNGSLPDNWYLTELGELAEILMGQSPKGNTYNTNGDGVPLLNGPAEFGRKFPTAVQWTTAPTRIANPGDILFCVRGNTTGRMNMADRQYCVGRGLAAVRGKPERAETSFVSFLLDFINNDVYNVAIGGGSTFPNISRSSLIEFEVPVPPLPEQRKIAVVLGLVQRAIEQQERLIALTTELKKALLHKLFTEGLRGEPQKQTEIGPVPESWEVSKLADLFEIKHGYAFDGAFFRPDGQYILLTPGHFFEEGGFRDQKDKTRYYVGEIPHGYVLAKGDLLVAMTEQKAGLLGSTIIVPESGKFLHNQRLGLIQNLDEQRLTKLFLYYFFNTAAVRKQIFLTSSGSKVRHTSPSKIRELRIALPSLDEQNEIVQLLQAADTKFEVTERKRQSITDLFRTLLHQLMTAQIRVNDLDLDEILRQPVAEIGDATVNPPIVGNGRDRSLRGNRVHNRPVQDRGDES
jgi:type I restriction enzyme S subunit